MDLYPPPLLHPRPPAEQLVATVAMPVVFGVLTGLTLGWSEAVYLVLSILGIAGRLPRRHGARLAAGGRVPRPARRPAVRLGDPRRSRTRRHRAQGRPARSRGAADRDHRELRDAAWLARRAAPRRAGGCSCLPPDEHAIRGGHRDGHADSRRAARARRVRAHLVPHVRLRRTGSRPTGWFDHTQAGRPSCRSRRTSTGKRCLDLASSDGLLRLRDGAARRRRRQRRPRGHDAARPAGRPRRERRRQRRARALRHRPLGPGPQRQARRPEPLRRLARDARRTVRLRLHRQHPAAPVRPRRAR